MEDKLFTDKKQLAKDEEKEKAKEAVEEKHEEHKKHEEKKAEKKEEKKEEKKREIVLERVHTVSLVDAYKKTATKRSDYAINLLKAFALRHMKGAKVRIATAVNDTIRKSSKKPVKKIRLNMTKDKEGLVLVEPVKK